MADLHSRRQRFFLAVLLTLAWVAAVRADPVADEREDLQSTIRVLTAERDRLRNELAAAKLRMETLEGQVAAMKSAGAGAGGGPTTQPASTYGDSSGVRKEWIVEVTGNVPPDLRSLEAEVKSAKDSLSSITSRLEQARNQFNDLTRRSDYYYYNERPYHYENGRRVYDDEISPERKKILTEAKSSISKLEQQESTARVRLTRAEQNLTVKQGTCTVDGRTDDGTPVRITASGTAKSTAEGMAVGQRYRVNGTGTTIGGALQITLRSAAPAN